MDIIKNENSHAVATVMRVIRQVKKNNNTIKSRFLTPHQIKEVTKFLDIPVTLLDELAKQLRAEFTDTTENILPKVEPWNEAVVLKDLLNEIVETLDRFLVFSSHHQVRVIALWIIHTHCIDAASVTPILNINSPEKRCGKSTLLALLQRLVKRPLIASNISAAAVFRAIEKWAPTLLIDEGDSFMRENNELRGVINSGHTRDSAYIIRCVGKKHEPMRFSTWGAKAIAGIGHRADTIEDRSVCIQLRRKLPHEIKEQLRDAPDGLFNKLIRQCVRVAVDNSKALIFSRPSIPRALNDRAADNWQPLLAIADLADSEWPKMAREAALALSNIDSTPTVSIELLQDIKKIFETKQIDRVQTVELLQALSLLSESPWANYSHDRALTDRQLARLLGDFGIRSKDIRFIDNIRKGYELRDFEDTFQRYLPKFLGVPNSSATTLHASDYVACDDLDGRNTDEMLRQ